MEFKEWLMNRRICDTPNGDFISDVKQDSKFPESGTKESYLNYLWGACPEAKRCFRHWWCRYAKEEKL